MIVQTSPSVTTVPAVRDDTSSALAEEGISLEGLSLAQKETFNLARDARHGDNVRDKALLNVVQPPALVLFTLLDTGRMSPEVPLPQAQNAYDTMANTRDAGTADDPIGATSDTGAKTAKTGSGFAHEGGTATTGHATAAKAAAMPSAAQSSPSPAQGTTA